MVGTKQVFQCWVLQKDVENDVISSCTFQGQVPLCKWFCAGEDGGLEFVREKSSAILFS